MRKLREALLRLSRTAVFWFWVFNGLRLSSGLLVLPLLVIKLSRPDYGMYFVFLSLSALAPVLDLGFSVSLGRAVNYAMGGATRLQAWGVAPKLEAGGTPNQKLLWELLHTTRQLYRILAAVVIGLMGLGGTWFIHSSVPQTTSPSLTWMAWGVTVAAMAWDVYSGWWSTYLRNMNQVLVSARQGVYAQALKLALSCGLLLVNVGLLSVPLATILASGLQRLLARRVVLRRLDVQLDPGRNVQAVRELFRTLWPNTWRIGVHFLGGYLTSQAATLLCLPLLGLGASARYGFSIQLIAVCSGMAQVWTAVKWPLVGQLRVKQDYPALQRLLRPRVWLQYLTYLGLVVAVIVIVPALLRWYRSDKELLPLLWLCLLAGNGFFELRCIFWTTLIATENRLPMVWPYLISNATTLAIIVLLIRLAHFDLEAFVVAPLAVGWLYNYWKWPAAGARSIGTTVWKFLVGRSV